MTKHTMFIKKKAKEKNKQTALYLVLSMMKSEVLCGKVDAPDCIDLRIAHRFATDPKFTRETPLDTSHGYSRPSNGDVDSNHVLVSPRAQITVPAEERRDDERLYHKMTVAELQTGAPLLNWTAYFNSAFSQINKTIPDTQEVVVYAPEYMANMTDLVREYLASSKGKVCVRLASILWRLVGTP